MERELIAKLLINGLPQSIFQRLRTQGEFLEPLGLSPRTTVTVGSVGTFDISALFHSIRGALTDAGTCEVVDVEGNKLSISSTGDGWQIQREPEGPVQRVSHPAFLLLAADAAERVKAFDELRADLGPTAPQFEAIRAALPDRRATDAELRGLFAEVEDGVAGQQRSTVAAIKGPRFSLADLVPNDLAFFEKCYGPAPGCAPVDDYFAAALPEFRRNLLSRDLARGLSLCLPAYVRDDLTLAGLIESRSNDEVWQALEAAAPLSDPFSVLATLDLAISRTSQDERFRELSLHAAERLIAERFPGDGNADLYVLLPSLAVAVEDQLSGLEGAMSRPPFWRRLCAFAHSSWLMRHLRLPEGEMQPFCGWLGGQHALPDRVREILDFRAEPMWLTSNLSAEALRTEILARLALLVERHRRNGCEIPALEKISAAIERNDDRSGKFARYHPGPLEGHLRPAAFGGERLLTDSGSQDLIEHLSCDLASPTWAATATASDIFALPEAVLSAVTRLVAPGEPGKHMGSIAKRRLGLLSAGLIAARHRHRDLADAVAAHCLAEAPHAIDAEGIDTLFTALLVASASVQGDDEWTAWIEPQLFSLAERLPADAASAHDWLSHALSALRALLPPRANVAHRAEALMHMLP
jgi:hypothetical protein